MLFNGINLETFLEIEEENILLFFSICEVTLLCSFDFFTACQILA